MKCEICDKEYKNNLSGGLTLHIKKVHNISEKDYYDMYFLKDKKNICSICNNELPFVNLNVGYKQECPYCTGKLSIKECKICGKKFGNLHKHIKDSHNISIEQYFTTYIKNEKCETCLKTNCIICEYKSKEGRIKCELCGNLCKNLRYLRTHLSNVHKVDTIEYYDKYLKKPGEGICLTCGKPTKLYRFADGYQKFCNISCAQQNEQTKNKIKATMLKRYGEENPFSFGSTRHKDIMLEKYRVENAGQSKEIHDKVKHTNLEKYGATNIFASEYGKQKIKETNIEKYGVDNPAKNKDIQSKMQQTNLERYGTKAFNQTKAKQTNLEKYGFEYAIQSPEIRDKKVKTNLEKYGSTCSLNNKEVKNKAKKTFIEHYGVDNPLKSNKIREQIKQTNLEKYGVENPGANKDIMEKRHQTILEKYGVDNAYQSPEIQERMKQTLQNNQNLDDELNNADE